MGDLTYEKQFIGGILQNNALMDRVRRAKIQPEHITDFNCRYLFKKILQLHDERSEINDTTLKHVVKYDNKVDQKEKAVYVNMIDDLAGQDLDGVQFSVNFLKTKRRNLELKRLLQTSANLFIESQDASSVIADIYEEISRLKDDNFEYEINEYTSAESWQKRTVERIEITSDSSNAIKFHSNLAFLDKYFSRGLEKATITAIGGTTGVGKSLMLNNIAYLAIHPKNKLNGLYIIAENKRIQTESRIDSVILDRKYDDLFPKNITRDDLGDKFFENLYQQGFGKLFTAKVIVDRFDAADIAQMIEEIIDGGDSLDFLVIDSPDHMKPMQWMQKRHERKGQVYVELKDLCDRFEIPIITSLPMTASSAKQNKISAEDTAGSYDIAKICDNQIFFYKSAEDELLGRRQIEVVKNRDGILDGEKIPLKLRNTLRFEPWDDAVVGIEDTEYVEYKIRRQDEYKKTVFNKMRNKDAE